MWQIIIHIQEEKARMKDRLLGDSGLDRHIAGLDAIYDGLLSILEEILDPNTDPAICV